MKLYTVKIHRTVVDTFMIDRVPADQLIRAAEAASYGPTMYRTVDETEEDWADRLLTDEGILFELCKSHGDPDETESEEYEVQDVEIEDDDDTES